MSNMGAVGFVARKSITPMSESRPPEKRLTASNVSGSSGVGVFLRRSFGATNKSQGASLNEVRQTSPERKASAVFKRPATFSQRLGSDTTKVTSRFRVHQSEADFRPTALSIA